jgi:hypothetical protein
MKPERAIFTNLGKTFFSEMYPSGEDGILFLHLPAGHNIYQLWQRLEFYNFETDVIEEVRELFEPARKSLEGYVRDDFSQVFLFFDYDGQHGKYEKYGEAIPKMLKVFADETEHGKLYINYPMIECIRDTFLNAPCVHRCIANINSLDKYKKYVGEMTGFPDARKYDDSAWKWFCKVSLQRSYCIENHYICSNSGVAQNETSVPNYDTFKKKIFSGTYIWEPAGRSHQTA